MKITEEHTDTTTPAAHVTLITLYVRYEWSDNLYQHVCVIDAGFTIEKTVASWMKSDRAELVDWCVSEYAPIPF